MMEIEEVLAGRSRWAVAEGDSLKLIAEMPDACVDACIADPPYSSGGMFRGDRTMDVKSKYVQTGTKIGSRECVDFSGDNRDQRSFVYWCALWMSELRRVVKPGGVLGCFIDWRQLPSMTDAVTKSLTVETPVSAGIECRIRLGNEAARGAGFPSLDAIHYACSLGAYITKNGGVKGCLE